MRRMDFDEVQYRQLVNTGIAAVKGGDREQARVLLQKATEMRPTDSQTWLWLSATTDDPAEQRDYLEQALAADPNNGAARRGLVLLSEKLDKSRLLPEGQGLAARHPTQPEEAQAAETFLCPKCGGHMKFEVQQQALVCEFCGHTQATEEHRAADEAEQVLDFVLPTTRGHRWAESQHRLACERCGAVTVLPAGQTVDECPYCGARRLVESEETAELIDPQVVGLAQFDEDGAIRYFREWLGRGLFAPDDLKKLAQTSALRPAYYPFWTFDGTLELHWSCEVNEGSSDAPRWVGRQGVEFEMFDDVLVPGLRAFSVEDLSRIEPFPLKEVVAFEPDFLAGWKTLTYDLSLAEASLSAREEVVRKVRRELYRRVQITQQKRDLRSGGVNWSGMTFKYVLLPIWVGTYRYRGREYRLLINGQTGKIGGQKPRDGVKVVAVGAALVFTLFFLLVVLAFLALNFGWISL